MASSSKKSNSKKNSQARPSPLPDLSPKRQAKLAFGILLLVIGLYLCLCIFSYFITWKQDQDALISADGLVDFLSNHTHAVSNWGGALGAALAHFLVYETFGIGSFAIGVWLLSWGGSIIYNHRRFAVIRYLRWIAILLLVLSPILAFLLPDHPFHFGGGVGNSMISFANQMVGKMGTAMLLVAFSLFFLFVIVALDIRPMIRRARKTASAIGAGIVQMKDGVGEKVGEWNAGSSTEAIADLTTDALENIEEKNLAKQYDIQEHTDNPIAQETSLLATGLDVEDKISEEEANYQDWLASALAKKEDSEGKTEKLNSELEVSSPKSATGVEDLSFEVTTKADDANPVILHGSHISLEDNEPYDPEDDLPKYKFPTLDLLEERGQDIISLDKKELEKNKNQIINTLKSFGIEISKISAIVGPTVTLYEIIPAEGVRISKIRNLEDDIALNLAALGIRIIAPIPGRGTIGIEVPNANKQIVSMKTLLASEKFVHSKMSLPIALGKKIDNENYIVDLASMPHLLVAGATGQGKSVGINAILISLLYKKHPSQLKFVLVDPKIVELSIYRKIEKHYLAKLPNEEEAIITDTKKVIYTLNSLCIEMDNRYELLKDANTRNIKEYNEKFVKRKLSPLNGHKYLPFIVLVIDEFADLIMTAGKEIEMPIARLAQKARAVGIHIIIATQRPSVNVITGVIKANFPARIAFKVSSKIDSRTILDTGGAEQLIGRGDMLISHGSELMRLQCAFVDTPEVENIVNHIGDQRGYATAFDLPEYDTEEDSEKIIDLTNKDKLFEDCARMVVQTGNGSTSNLQRRLNLGYNRAGRIMDQLEAAGIVGPSVGSKPRDVLVKTEMELEQFLDSIN